MNRLRSMLTYSNVVSTACLFLLLGGGVALAAGQLGKNTVGTKQLKKNSISAVKVKNGAITTDKLGNGSVAEGKLQDGAVSTGRLQNGSVTNPKLADNSVDGAKVADGSLTGADINQSTLTGVRASNISTISVNTGDDCAPTSQVPAGVKTSFVAEGVCKVTFPSPVVNCNAQATSNSHNTPNIQKIPIGARGFQLFTFQEDPNTLWVYTYLNDKIVSLPFDLAVIC